MMWILKGDDNICLQNIFSEVLLSMLEGGLFLLVRSWISVQVLAGLLQLR